MAPGTVDGQPVESERPFGRARARRAMRDRVTIGQEWRRRRDKVVGEIVQVHRADREVEIQAGNEVLLVGFTDLRTKWALLS